MRQGAYAELWGVVDGAVVDAFKNHPDYLTDKGRVSARPSIVKRVTGTVLSFAAQAARGRALHPAETPPAVLTSQAGEGAANSSSPNPHCRIGKITLKPTPQPRCECGRFCAKEHKPDITDKLVSDMSAAGLYVPAKFRVQKSIDSIAGRSAS